MRFVFIKEHKREFPTTLLCNVLKVSSSGFYAWLKRPESKRARENEDLVKKVRQIYEAGRKHYGSPRIHDRLRAEGISVGRNRVARLMRQNGISARPKRRFRRTTDSNHDYPIADNILERNFDVDRPDQVWVSDITYLWTLQGWLYLAVVIDLFSRRVVGWSLANHMKTQLVLSALRMALGHRVPESGMVHHSDRGVQYASKEYRKVLKEHGIRCSMSRKGNCWDNAVSESFFATIEKELIDDEVWTSHKQARPAIAEYIEVFYNRQRIHSYLDYQSPVEYEEKHEQELTKAA